MGLTNREWINLIAKEFNVNNTTAKEMLHAMYEVRKRKCDYLDYLERQSRIKQEQLEWECINPNN